MNTDHFSQELSVLVGEIAQNDIPFARYLLQSLLCNAEEIVFTLQSRHQQGQALIGSDVAQQLHKLVGSSGLMGLTSMVQFLREKESCAAQHESVHLSWLLEVLDTIDTLLNQYTRELDVLTPS